MLQISLRTLGGNTGGGGVGPSALNTGLTGLPSAH
jgi:hypothetical protein